jgi:sugar phosphate isomerase/epimerase
MNVVEMSIAMTIYGVAPRYDSAQRAGVLDTDELLHRLEDRGIRNVDIARVLGLPDSRIPEIRDKRRAIKLDEGAKLTRAFGLEPVHKADPLPASVVRLLVRYMAAELRADTTEEHLADLAEDVRAFAEFVADPKVRSSVEAAEAFFQAMRLRRPKAEAEGRSENDHDHTR